MLIGTAIVAGCGNDDDPKGAKVVKVAISDAGCEPAALKLAAGPTTFEVTNKGSAKVTDFEVLEGKRILGDLLPQRRGVRAGSTYGDEYIKHVGSAVFACPPGARPGGYVGQGLLS